jgi:hypothetical protein
MYTRRGRLKTRRRIVLEGFLPDIRMANQQHFAYSSHRLWATGLAIASAPL